MDWSIDWFMIGCEANGRPVSNTVRFILVTDEGRSFVRRRTIATDAITLVQTMSDASTPAGALTLSDHTMLTA